METVDVVEPMDVVEQEKDDVPSASMIVEEIENISLYGMSELMKLKRFCYLGSFEPVYIHLRFYINVGKFWPIVKALVEKISDTDFIPFLRDVLQDASLVRRDEVLFVYAAYLASSVKIEHKTALRISFSVLIETDDDLFLFCKYTSLIAREQKRKCFSRTVRKAIKGWYERKTEDDMRSMWLAHRGSHGFTHKNIIKLCHINDSVIGSHKVASPFFKTCTEILREENIAVEPRRRYPEPSTSSVAYGKSDSFGQTYTKLVEHDSAASQVPTSIITAVSKLRTTKKPENAINIVEKFQLPFKHVPGNFLRQAKIMETLLPTMSYLQILKYWGKMILYRYFITDNNRVFAIIQNLLESIDFIMKHRIHPVHLLMRLHKITRKPLKKVSERAICKMNLDYIQNLYHLSFHWPVEPANLRMFITVNLQKNYKKKFLKNHKKRISFFDALFALAFGYFKRETQVDVYNWVENKLQLEQIPLSKTFSTETALRMFRNIGKTKSSQRLATPLAYAFASEQVYDVFLCIVPKAGRSNPKQNSEYLAKLLDRYRREKNPKARFIILSLLKSKPRSMQYSDTHLEHILEICGLDNHTTDLIHNFATHKFD